MRHEWDAKLLLDPERIARWAVEGDDTFTDYGVGGELVRTEEGDPQMRAELLRLAEEVERLKAVSMTTVGDLDVGEEIVRLMERWDAEDDDDPLWKQTMEYDWRLSDFLGVGLTEALRAAGHTERARIREELLAWVAKASRHRPLLGTATGDMVESVRMMTDRICPP